LFIEKENQMTKRTKTKYSKEFKQSVCEYYSNYTWRDTAVHFGMAEDQNNKRLYTRWYRELGFLPKSAGRNPSLDRMPSTTKKRARAGMFIKSGGYIFDNKFYGEAEFVQLKVDLNSSDTYYVVAKHKVGATVKRNPITKFFSRFI
tara:strand:- start:493 stop:930 length:438 start_codon:yes stop_codon:yes gene_type:complete